jgi:hypothetical protein
MRSALAACNLLSSPFLQYYFRYRIPENNIQAIMQIFERLKDFFDYEIPLVVGRMIKIQQGEPARRRRWAITAVQRYAREVEILSKGPDGSSPGLEVSGRKIATVRSAPSRRMRRFPFSRRRGSAWSFALRSRSCR